MRQIIIYMKQILGWHSIGWICLLKNKKSFGLFCCHNRILLLIKSKIQNTSKKLHLKISKKSHPILRIKNNLILNLNLLITKIKKAIIKFFKVIQLVKKIHIHLNLKLIYAKIFVYHVLNY